MNITYLYSFRYPMQIKYSPIRFMLQKVSRHEVKNMTSGLFFLQRGPYPLSSTLPLTTRYTGPKEAPPLCPVIQLKLDFQTTKVMNNEHNQKPLSLSRCQQLPSRDRKDRMKLKRESSWFLPPFSEILCHPSRNQLKSHKGREKVSISLISPALMPAGSCKEHILLRLVLSLCSSTLECILCTIRWIECRVSWMDPVFSPSQSAPKYVTVAHKCMSSLPCHETLTLALRRETTQTKD